MKRDYRFCIKIHSSSVVDVLCLKVSIHVVVNNVWYSVSYLYCVLHGLLLFSELLTPTWLLAYT